MRISTLNKSGLLLMDIRQVFVRLGILCPMGLPHSRPSRPSISGETVQPLPGNAIETNKDAQNLRRLRKQADRTLCDV